MKKTLKITALALVLVLCLAALASCAGSSFGKIQKNFEKEGYVLDRSVDSSYETEEGKEINYTIHTFKKPGTGLDALVAPSATVYEFASAKDVATAKEEIGEVKAVLEKVQDERYIKGNCVLMTPPVFNADAEAIFNGESPD